MWGPNSEQAIPLENNASQTESAPEPSGQLAEAQISGPPTPEFLIQAVQVGPENLHFLQMIR